MKNHFTRFQSCSPWNRNGHIERKVLAIPLTCICYRNGGKAWTLLCASQVLSSLGFWVISVHQLQTYLAIDLHKRNAKEKRNHMQVVTLPHAVSLPTTESCCPEYQKNSYFQLPKQRRFSSTDISLLLLFPGCTLAGGNAFLSYLGALYLDSLLSISTVLTVYIWDPNLYFKSLIHNLWLRGSQTDQLQLRPNPFLIIFLE